jgi:hypothetical protein
VLQERWVVKTHKIDTRVPMVTQQI